MKRYIKSATSEANELKWREIEDTAELDAQKFINKFVRANEKDYPGLDVTIKDIQTFPDLEADLENCLIIFQVRCDSIPEFEWRSWYKGLSMADINLRHQLRVMSPKKRVRDSKSQSAKLFSMLEELGVDTTKCSYRLVARTYHRMGYGDTYTKNFTCNGDYLAYFSMKVHQSPTLKALLTWWDDVEDLQEFMDDHPTLQDIRDCASYEWYGDGDDWIISLVNKTTSTVLYENEDYYDGEEW